MACVDPEASRRLRKISSGIMGAVAPRSTTKKPIKHAIPTIRFDLLKTLVELPGRPN
jgi:hypothetical protein